MRTNTNTQIFTNTYIQTHLVGALQNQTFGEEVERGIIHTQALMSEVELTPEQKLSQAFLTLTTCPRCFCKHNGECV